ncbi:hypothetical protein JCGZ_16152 [Jatropha curcas]|uniref:Uncharacterized protein n=1 Tax=Jatropha curcas TaxID=180498 RepID=A0A067K603_JATCU|nr:hypothetical protein JCGZ_16152 [Jatropha curcas]
MPSTLVLFIALFYSLLLLSPLPTIIGANSLVKVAVAARPLESKPSKNSVIFKPKSSHRKKGFGGRDMENCMPKGFHRTSAPSRYINYNTLGSTICETSKHVDAP